MSKKKVYSIKRELLKKSREAVLAAVSIYNNPQMTFKSETFITLIIIGWTYLMHAYYRDVHVDYRYKTKVGKKVIVDKTKYGAYKHWELEACLNNKKCPLDKDTIANLKFLIGIRHEIEHQMTDKIDEFLSAKLQASAINYDYYITRLFGEKYSINESLSLAIQFSPIAPSQMDELKDNEHIILSVKNFIVDFEEKLSEDQLQSSRYAYRVLFVPINAKRRGQADRVVEFIRSDSPLAEGIEKQYALIKETEKNKYLPSQIVLLMNNEGYTKFNMSKHTDLWKREDAKNPDKHYGVLVAKTWYWYDSWIQKVRDYCEANKEKLI